MSGFAHHLAQVFGPVPSIRRARERAVQGSLELVDDDPVTTYRELRAPKIDPDRPLPSPPSDTSTS